MSHPILFVCQSCRVMNHEPDHESDHESDYESDHEDETRPAEGSQLLDRLRALHQQWDRGSELEIRPVGCLWICRQACAVALQSADRPTYLFTHLPGMASAADLMQFSALYLDSAEGQVPWKQIPQGLRKQTIARIPFGEQDLSSEDSED